MRTFPAILLVSAAARLIAQSVPDQLILTTGEQLAGEFESSDPKGVTFASKALGELTIPWDKIKEIHSPRAFAVIPKEQRLQRPEQAETIPRGSIELRDRNVVVQEAQGRERRNLPVADAYIVEKETFDSAFEPSGILGGWTGSVTLGSSLVAATQNSTEINAEVDLERAVPAMDWMSNTSRTAVSFSNSYGWSRNRFPGRENEKVKTFVYQAAAEHDRYLAPRIFGFAQAIYTHNLAQNLELQQSYMGGLGVAIIKRPHHNFQWKGSLGYIQRGYYISALNVDVIGSTFGESYEYQYKRARLYEEISGTPAWNNSNRWAAASKASLRLPITESLGFEVSSMDSYLHGAPSGYKKNSFQLWFGISYSFE